MKIYVNNKSLFVVCAINYCWSNEVDVLVKEKNKNLFLCEYHFESYREKKNSFEDICSKMSEVNYEM